MDFSLLSRGAYRDYIFKPHFDFIDTRIRIRIRNIEMSPMEPVLLDGAASEMWWVCWAAGQLRASCGLPSALASRMQTANHAQRRYSVRSTRCVIARKRDSGTTLITGGTG
jgi:hypothetical protein